MKIRIKNIFVNKKTKEKDGNSEKTTKRDNSIRYKELKLKKVYDVNNVDEKKGSKETVRRRNGYTKINNDLKENEPKIKLYYENLVKNKNKLNRGYYVLLVSMFILGIGSVVLASKTYNLFNAEDYQAFSSIDENKTQETFEKNESYESTEKKEIELQSIETSNKDTKEDVENVKNTSNNTNNNSKKTTVNSSKKETVKVTPLNFSKPISGEILKVYSPDKVIYSKTLELWKVHDGIDIKVNEGEYVKSIERGTVEKVYEDSFYGITIVIDHGQGYKSSYSNLDKNTLVKEKQTINKGQKIGKIGRTSIGEIKDESHLHFMLYKNGVSQDPTNIFK